MKDFLLNISSFGGHNRFLEEKKIYDQHANHLSSRSSKHERIKKELNEKINFLVDEKIKAIETVSKIKNITESISIKDRLFIEDKLESKDYTLNDIEKSLSISNELINIGKSSFTGVAVSGLSVSAAWSSATVLATASTGTAISTLSGAAATNATLAWFGGGSLSAGGLGMAGGTMVLGGLVIIPAVIIAGLVQYKSSQTKIIQIKEDVIKVIKATEDVEKNLTAFTAIDERFNEYELSLNKSVEVFDNTYIKTYKYIYRYGRISKFYKKIRKILFGIPLFNQLEVEEIAFLGKCTADIVKIIDTKII
jgi:hypothetical protein